MLSKYGLTDDHKVHQVQDGVCVDAEAPKMAGGVKTKNRIETQKHVNKKTLLLLLGKIYNNMLLPQ